jgi:uncharacterized protein (TIGR00369 family)
MTSVPSVEEVNAFVAEVFPAAARGGIRCEALEPGTAVARWPIGEGGLRPGGSVAGPRIFALADAALWFATFTVLGLEPMAVTIEMSIRFVRPARSGDLLARAVVNSTSARRIVGTVEVWVDGEPDRPVAVAQGSYSRP